MAMRTSSCLQMMKQAATYLSVLHSPFNTKHHVALCPEIGKSPRPLTLEYLSLSIPRIVAVDLWQNLLRF